MGTSNLLAFVLASIILILIPGPSLLFTVGRALSAGRRTAVFTVVGNGLGTFGQIVLVASGLGVVVTSSAVAYGIVKYAGAAYLIWLGVNAIRHRREHGIDLGGAVGPVPPVATGSTWKVVRSGAVVGATNPKTAVFMTALLPQFIDPQAAHPGLTLLALGALFVVMAMTSDTMMALLAGWARAWFGRSPRRMERLTGTGGVMMVGLGVGVAVSGRPE